jgi:hypothetical protein
MFENSQDKFALLIRDYQQLFGFSQYNNIYNSYDHIVDLVLSNYIRYNFKKANDPLLYSLISTADWSYLNSFTDVNFACEAFYQHLYSILTSPFH